MKKTNPHSAGELPVSETRLNQVSAKPDLQLKPGERADVSLKMILSYLLDVMEYHQEGIVKDVDPEFLHDYRIAVRRTRSLLGQLKGIFPKQTLDRATRRFAWLGAATSPLRDMDVYLLAFDGYRESLPAAMRDDLEPVREFLRAHREHEYQALVKVFESKRYHTFIEGWRRFLMAPAPVRTSLSNAGRPNIDVVNERIWKIYRRVIKEGRLIQPDTAPEKLHQLRKTCKKLRYLIEMFRSLYPAGKLKKTIKALKQLQDNLGLYQDLHVQICTLEKLKGQMQEEGRLPEATDVAIERLVKKLNKRQQKQRAEFEGRFSKFSTKNNRLLFRTLFRTTPAEMRGV